MTTLISYILWQHCSHLSCDNTALIFPVTTLLSSILWQHCSPLSGENTISEVLWQHYSHYPVTSLLSYIPWQSTALLCTVTTREQQGATRCHMPLADNTALICPVTTLLFFSVPWQHGSSRVPLGATCHLLNDENTWNSDDSVYSESSGSNCLVNV